MVSLHVLDLSICMWPRSELTSAIKKLSQHHTPQEYGFSSVCVLMYLFKSELSHTFHKNMVSPSVFLDQNLQKKLSIILHKNMVSCVYSCVFSNLNSNIHLMPKYFFIRIFLSYIFVLEPIFLKKTFLFCFKMK